MIPVIDLAAQLEPIKAELMAAFERCIDHRGFCLGPEVENFEKSFADYVGIDHVVGVNSGTSALHIAARLLGLGPGDEVITTPHTFVATSWAIAYAGAKPVFVDIDPLTMNINPELLEGALTEKTKAVFAVHLYGHPCELNALSTFCKKNGLALVEDAAQAHGAKYFGRTIGSIGDLATYSFYPGKNLGACGEAGALATNDATLAERARVLRNHGASRPYYHDVIGYNYRMEGLQAAALGVKLPHLTEWTSQRQRIAHEYHKRLATTPLKLPREAAGHESAYHLYVVRHPRRDVLKDFLVSKNIASALHYPIPLHLQQCFSNLGYKTGDFPVAEQAANECLSLPLYPEMSDVQIDQVCEAIHSFFAHDHP